MQIHVVDEGRQFASWTDDEKLAKEDAKYVSLKSGIISAKRALNDLHYWLGKNSYTQVSLSIDMGIIKKFQIFHIFLKLYCIHCLRCLLIKST